MVGMVELFSDHLLSVDLNFANPVWEVQLNQKLILPSNALLFEPSVVHHWDQI